MRGPEGRAAADRAAGVTGPGPEGRGVTRRSARQTGESKAPAVTPVTVTPVTVTTMRTVPPARACAHEPAAAEKPARVCTDGGSPGPRPPPADGELRGDSPLPGLQDPRGPQRTPRTPPPAPAGTRSQGGAARTHRVPRRRRTGRQVAVPPKAGLALRGLWASSSIVVSDIRSETGVSKLRKDSVGLYFLLRDKKTLLLFTLKGIKNLKLQFLKKQKTVETTHPPYRAPARE